MKRKISFFMALLMFFGSFSGLTHVGLAEKEAEKISVEAFSVENKEEATGNKLKIEIKTKEETKVPALGLYFKEPITGKDYLVKLYRKEDKKSFIYEESPKGLYEGSYQAYKLVALDEKEVEDKSYQLDMEKELLNKSFKVKDSDKKPVEVENLILSNNNLKPGKQATYILELKEEIDVKEVVLAYTKPLSKQNFSVKLDKVGDKKYSGNLTIDDYMENGLYEFSYLGFKDSRNNSYVLTSKDGKIENFTVSGTSKADSKSPVVSKLTLDRERYGLGKSLQMTVELEEEDSVEEMKLVYKLDGKDELYTINLKHASGKVYRGKQVIAKDTSLGKYSFDFVSGYDKANNPIEMKEDIALPSFEILSDWSSQQTVESVKSDRKIYEIRDYIEVEAKISNLGKLDRVIVEYRTDDLAHKVEGILYKVNKDTFKGRLDWAPEGIFENYHLYRVWEEGGKLLDLASSVEDGFEISSGLEALVFEDFKLDPRLYGGTSLEFSKKDLYVRNEKDSIYTPLKTGSIKVSVKNDKKETIKDLLIKVKDQGSKISYREEYRNNRPIKFKTIEKINPLLEAGSKQILVEGKEGIKSDFYKHRYQDGKFVSTYEFKDMVLKEAIDQVVEVAGEGLVENFMSKGVRIRDEKASEVGYLKKGELIKGVVEGNKVRFIYQGKEVTVHKNFLTKIEDKIYLSKGARMRDAQNKDLGYLKKGHIIEGSLKGNKIYFKHGETMVSIHKNFASEQGYEDYISKGANIRDLNNKKVSYLSKGEKIRASLIGERVYYSIGDKLVSADIKFMEDSRPYRCLSNGAIIRDLYGKKIGYLEAGQTIAGRKSGDYVLVNYGNNLGRIHKSVAYPGGERAYISKGVNVRDLMGTKWGYLKKGEMVFGRVYRHDESLIEINYNFAQGLLDKRFVE